MSHPYRKQLSSGIGENIHQTPSEKGTVGHQNDKAFSIKPHQILANQQLKTNTRKSHPFLQQLPTEVSRSLESLHMGSPQRQTFEKPSLAISPAESTTANSAGHSSHSSVAQSVLSHSHDEPASHKTQKVSEMHAKSIANDVSSRENSSKVLKNDTGGVLEPKLPDISLKSPTESSTASAESSSVELSQISKIADISGTPNNTNLIERETIKVENGEKNKRFDMPENIEKNIPKGTEKGKAKTKEHTTGDVKEQNSIYKHTKTKSTANLIHPVYDDLSGNADPGTEAPPTIEADKSNVNLLPLGTSIEMYRKNMKKIKNPEALLSFAQILIRTSLSKRSDNPLTPKEKEQYLDEACSALKKSSKAGCIEAQYYLGDAYSVGLFNKGKPELGKSLTYFEAAGKAKHAESAYRTAMCYKKGWGCTRDARKVLKYLEIAAINNHPVAMMECGIYAFHGLMSFPEDVNTKKKGINWLRRATECATELSCGAPYELALIYMNGFKDIVIQDTTYAIKLLFQASNLGHARSSAMLGKFYEIGDIVEQNPDLSIHFYNISANAGDVDGMMGLCSWYFVGSPNLPQDYDEAFAWALRAAEHCNHVKAMLLLERFYELGAGCNKDIKKSKYWGDLARAQMKEKRV